MFKPNDYDNVQASGEFVPVTPGGHYCVIKKVEETQSKTGKPMIVVYFDFTERDMQAGYFMNSYTEDTREDKTWPFAGRKYIMVNDFRDSTKTSRQFKTFCSCVEKSNDKFIVQWGNDWGKQFAGKLIGAVYGREESEYNGNVTMRCLPKYFCQIDAVANAKTPEDKYLAPKAETPAFDDVLNSEDLPF